MTLLPYIIQEFINEFSKYTMGIVAVHYPIYALMNVLIFQSKNPRLNLKWGVIHYILCLVIIMFGGKVSNGYIKKAFY